MRIVQTFWTAGRNPLEHSFGWLRPEYNLMSWTLSCLSLREHYNEVALYTDEQGKHVLIDLLHLPYTEVHVVYDEHLCLPQHWAYAKIKTYSLQTKPFVHVDGDVFLPRPIPEDIMRAPLIAQNKERGTEYYRKMMDKLRQESVLDLPEYMEDALREESIASYNMGLFGGNDLDFIRAFSKEAMTLCDANKEDCSDGNFNLLFEQMLLASIARQKDIPISTVYPGIYNDNGYTAGEFCNFSNFCEGKLLHLLGGHKRNKDTIWSFEKFMLRRYLNQTKRVLSIVTPRNIHNSLSCCRIPTNNLIYKIVPEFRDFISQRFASGKHWETDVLLYEEKQRTKTLPFHDEGKEHKTMVKLTTGLSVFELPKDIQGFDLDRISEMLACERHFPLSHIAVYPSLRGDRLEAVPLDDTESQILTFMEGGTMTTKCLRDQIIKGVCHTPGRVPETIMAFSCQHINYLINTGVLIITK